MAIYDHNGTTAYEIGKLYDHDGTASRQIGEVYDHNGTSSSLIYSAETYLYNGGAWDTSLTGGQLAIVSAAGWGGAGSAGSLGTVTYGASTFTAALTASGQNGCIYYTPSPVSLTGFSKVRFSCPSVANNNQTLFFVSATKPTAGVNPDSIDNAYYNFGSSVTTFSDVTADIDVSSLNGNYYICMFHYRNTYASSYAASITCSAIQLVE